MFDRVNIPHEYQCIYNAAAPGSFCLWGSGVVTMDVTFVSAGGKRGWAIDQFQYEFLPVPEPATMLPAAFGCTALLLLRRRRSRGLWGAHLTDLPKPKFPTAPLARWLALTDSIHPGRDRCLPTLHPV